MTPRVRSLLRARPGDFALALSVAGASLLAPEAVSATAKYWLTPGITDLRRRDRESTHDVSVAALRGVVSSADLHLEWPAAEKTPPIWDAMRQRRYLYRRGVHYGDSPAQVLDVYRRKDLREPLQRDAGRVTC
jgi:hypothetical protein